MTTSKTLVSKTAYKTWHIRIDKKYFPCPASLPKGVVVPCSSITSEFSKDFKHAHTFVSFQSGVQ
jgi:hypothetical protein